MAQLELKFQKELVYSAKQDECLSDIITHRFKKGWPEIIIKHRTYPAVYIECKYEEARKTHPNIPIAATDLQRHCLKHMRGYGMHVMYSVKVMVDKKDARVYNIYDLDATEFNYNERPYFTPHGSHKGKLLWPTLEMVRVACLPQMLPTSLTE